MSEVFGRGMDRKEALKELIRRLHRGEPPQAVKAQFARVTQNVSPAELALVEQELVQEGMPRDEVMRLCDVHLAVFQESLTSLPHIAPPGHPVYILMEEHRLMLGLANQLVAHASRTSAVQDLPTALAHADSAVEVTAQIRQSESHYIREENVLFPYLEKHGVTQPPAIMWMEHDRIRELKKGLYSVVDGRKGMDLNSFASKLKEAAVALSEMLVTHFQKENIILFPTALKVMTEDEWKDARRQFDALGYTPFTPEEARVPLYGEVKVAPPPEPAPAGEVAFQTGSLSPEVLQALLNALPVDVTFVDKDDVVRYFNDAPDRIFPRTEAVIGRSVQNCHPQKSLHVVNQILNDFRAGRRDKAEFWINFQGKFVHIQYFPLRSKGGDYLGCIEVTQDVTGIRALQGEKRLLD